MPTLLRICSAVALGGLVACGGEGGGAGSLKTMAPAACQTMTDSIVPKAVLGYIANLDPKAQRFLVAPGTDSAMPDNGRDALQSKGPTFLFPPDPAQQPRALKQIFEKGDFTTLLVAFRGVTDSSATKATVHLHGTYYDASGKATPAASRALELACDTAVWHVVKSTDEPAK
jgi:hypothetical protein